MSALRYPKRRTTLSIALTLWLWGLSAVADVPLPPAPEHYFNDYAGFVTADVARRLDDTLRQFDEQTTSQVVVAIFPKLPAPSLEDFTARTAQAWRVGRKDLDNGVVLFVFAQDRKLRLEVGYGLEDRIPDAVAKRIVDDVIVPRFRSGDPAAGLTAGVEAILAAARGEASPALAETEPPGPSRVRQPDAGREHFLFVLAGVAITIFMIAASILNRAARSATFSRKGRQQAPQISGGGCLSLLGVLGGLGAYLWLSGLSEGAKALIFVLAVFGVVFLFILWAGFKGGWSGGSGWGTGGSAGGWSSGGWGSSGGGGGGFSGGGGSFGGGGASGSW